MMVSATPRAARRFPEFSPIPVEPPMMSPFLVIFCFGYLPIDR